MQARECARTIAGWKQLPVMPRPIRPGLSSRTLGRRALGTVSEVTPARFRFPQVSFAFDGDSSSITTIGLANSPCGPPSARRIR